MYGRECFGPVSFLVKTADTNESIELFRTTVTEGGAMTAGIYSTDAKVLDEAREAALDAGVALSENLTGQVFVFFVLTVAAAESAIGLAILVVLFRERRSISVEDLNTLKG